MGETGVYPISIDKCAKDSHGQPLVCGGCAHSAAGEAFPGMPSGERPCFFCIRNIERDAFCKEHLTECDGSFDGVADKCGHPAHGKWYNGTNAYKVPMDCYHSVDHLRQSHIWSGGSTDDVLFG